ncbi:MAG TPA: Ig-like domain-containing protein [Candidatus Saccharimonadales bacterium]|nr:Ig-like domain-containing protein [Candidatus Saccharimonadales bacterium]
MPTLPIWNEIRCFLEPKSLSSTNFSGSASGATNEVSIADPNACGWTVQSACDWVTISDNAGAGDFVVKISAGFNSSGLTRSCSLIIAGQNYVFNQAPCLYSLSPSAVTLPASGSNQTVTVTTADACGWIATSTNSWIEIGNTSTSIGSGQFSFSVLPNASLKTRTGTIRLAGQVLTVTQAADTEKPFAVAITEPATGQIYHFPQAVNISSSASDNIGVSRVEFYDGAIRRGVANTPPFTFAWQVGQTNNGAHLWTAKAYDAAGNLTVSPVVNLTVKVTPPLTSINFPTPLQRWSNQVITVQGKATDDLQVSGVYCKVNEGDWTLASSGNNWSNWTASATLNPGTNLISTYAEDATGNLSSTTKVSCIYVLSAQLALNVTGKGTLSPNYNGQSLEIGRGYTLTATPGAGFAFTNWTGNQTTNKPTLSFLMASNLEFTANFVDLQRPTLSITAPLANQRWSNELISVTGKVTDNYFVDSVYWKLNTGDWTPATTGNSWSNWTAAATLAPGTNVFRAYAQDSAGNLSSTSSVSFVYVLSAPVTVNVSGKGTLNPNYSGQRLELGRGYTITATPGPGFVFTNWTGSRATNKPALWFLMASNLEFSANFIDVQRPTLSIAAPTANQRWSNEIFTVQGKSGDNSSVEDVYWQLNGGDWTLASSANGWSNWMSAATLVPGTNFIRAYAQDGSGNRSATSSVSVVYVLAAPLSVNLSGKGSVTPNYNANALEIGRGYTMTATAGAGFVFTNWTGSHTTNKSTLWFLMASNLEFTANFLDIQRPTLSITAPLANQRLSNSTFIAQGKAIDNYQVTAVFQKLNESEWSLASSTNGWTNWVAELALTQSTNVFMAYAADAGGNLSTTNVITFLATNLVAAQLRLGLQSATLTESGEMELRFNISPSEAGRIEVSTNLIDWQFFSDFIGTNAFVRFTDPAARTHQLRFFRAVAPQR